MGPSQDLNAEHLLIRVDGNAQMGAGHVMRCLALAGAAQTAGRQPVFVMAQPAEALVHRLSSQGFQVHLNASEPGSVDDAVETAGVIRQRRAQWLVVDGYHFNARFLHILNEEGVNLLCIDDFGQEGYAYADVIVNQNGYADLSLYPDRRAGAHLLLGSRYVLLRPEFWPWRTTTRTIADAAHKVLVTLGGGDFHNVTMQVLQALQTIRDCSLQCLVVVGGSNPHVAQIQKAIEPYAPNYQLLRDVSNMPELMAWADIAVSAAGTTSWELAFMGLPTLAIVLADNQELVARYISEVGSAQNLGSYETLSAQPLADVVRALLHSPERRAAMSRAGRALVDGYGTQRVLAAMQN